MQIRFHALPVWQLEETRPRKKPGFSVTWDQTLKLLDRELRELAATKVVIQAGFGEGQIRMDGWPRSMAKTSHPGVVVSFDSKYGPLRYATDTFTEARVWIPASRRNSDRGGYREMAGYQANLRAIALGLEALRKVDRYGITKSGEQYTGWKQLTGESGSTTKEQALAVIGRFAELDGRPIGVAVREAIMNAHPDRGGSNEDFHLVKIAREFLMAEFD